MYYLSSVPTTTVLVLEEIGCRWLYYSCLSVRSIRTIVVVEEYTWKNNIVEKQMIGRLPNTPGSAMMIAVYNQYLYEMIVSA